MKANEAPEKIYIFDNPILDFTRLSVRQSNDDIEYIRKDAFIEKAADYIANNMRCDGYTFQTKVKFIRDFKKYIEESNV